MPNEVVAHFMDGRVIKGRCFDFSPLKPVCHVQPSGQPTAEIALIELKALFFVKDLRGDPEYQEGKALDPLDRRAAGARPMEVRFRDGEMLVGFVTGYSAERPHFFMTPADASSNNLRILINRAAVTVVKPVP